MPMLPGCPIRAMSSLMPVSPTRRGRLQRSKNGADCCKTAAAAAVALATAVAVALATAAAVAAAPNRRAKTKNEKRGTATDVAPNKKIGAFPRVEPL